MAVVEFINSERKQTKEGLASTLKYCMRKDKTQSDGQSFVTGINCVSDSAYSEMMNTKMQYGKTNKRIFYHVMQSFHPDEKISAETAHEIAVKFAEKMFRGFEVVVSTHTDVDHLHSHFVINSVSFENGYKFRVENNTLAKLRKESDDLCREYGLSVIEPKTKKSVSQMTPGEYRSAERNESWKMKLIVTIEDSMKVATNKETFCMMMQLQGYQVKWTDERKNITYTTPNGKKCCDDKLHETKFLKENMENEFRIRNEINGRIKKSDERFDGAGGDGRPLRNGNGEELAGDSGNAESADRNAGQTFGDAFKDGDRGSDFGFDGPAAGTSERGSAGHSGRGGGTEGSDDSDVFGNEDGSGSFNGRFEFTGWENEREVFLRSRRRAKEDEKVYKKNILDIAHPLMRALDIGSRAAYIIGNLMLFNENENNYKKDDDLFDFMAMLAGTAIGIALIVQEKKLKEEAKAEQAQKPKTEAENETESENHYNGPVMGGI